MKCFLTLTKAYVMFQTKITLQFCLLLVVHQLTQAHHINPYSNSHRHIAMWKYFPSYQKLELIYVLYFINKIILVTLSKSYLFFK